jgi:adenosylcobinamide-phosphate synthase
VEASFAGALGVRLGGSLTYGGRVEHRPVLNGAGRAVEVADIERAVKLSRRVTALAFLVCAAGRIGVAAIRGTRHDTGTGIVRAASGRGRA